MKKNKQNGNENKSLQIEKFYFQKSEVVINVKNVYKCNIFFHISKL